MSDVTSEGPQSRPQSVEFALPNGHDKDKAPEIRLTSSDSHGPGQPIPRTTKTSILSAGGDGEEWGSRFWVTLVDPQSGASFFACPATGDVSWDPPVGNFVLPPSDQGEWWEINDESRGIPYYYHTKSGETVWDRPDGFVIPLGILQVAHHCPNIRHILNGRQDSSIARRFSQRMSQNYSSIGASLQAVNNAAAPASANTHPSLNRRSRSFSADLKDTPSSPSDSIHPPGRESMRRSFSSDDRSSIGGPVPRGVWHPHHAHAHNLSLEGTPHLPTIPGSPPGTEVGDNSSIAPSPRQSLSPGPRNGSPTSERRRSSSSGASTTRAKKSPPSPTRSVPPSPTRNGTPGHVNGNANGIRDRTKSSASPGSGTVLSYRPHPANPSLDAAAEMLAMRHNHNNLSQPDMHAHAKMTHSPSRSPYNSTPPSPQRIQNQNGRSTSPPRMGGGLTAPNPSPGRVRKISTTSMKAKGKEGAVNVNGKEISGPAKVGEERRTIPQDLADEIQQFVESDFAKRYFSTHRTGFIFKRKVPMELMMMWQKAPLMAPLLLLNKTLHKDAVRIFRVIQQVMGDREYEGRRQPPGSPGRSPGGSVAKGILEEERWMLGEGILHGELRDEIYCQLVKQLSGNPQPDSVFRGWQLMSVLLITFPPSKNFEAYLRTFIEQRRGQKESRVDVMAKYCLGRLPIISQKGPRGKAPGLSEIESASDAPFNPSTFGEPLDTILRIQSRTYASLKVPIILPFLADGILALGGTQQEGIFRVPGDGDTVSELKARIDRGYYTLDGINDPHIPASLLKLWLRELQYPLVPEELYNDCIQCAASAEANKDPEECLSMISRLPTINRRVVLFVISFLQLFLEDKVQTATKMTAANLALVMAPNLLRCNSDSMAVVFTNAQYEQIFVYNLLLYLKCDAVDPDYVPRHGLGAAGNVHTGGNPRRSRGQRPA
ncbi:hypothetical protein SISNIDRAFT_475905 [Sistotremastrum niveocremeum HHB9708]|uniref:RhoGAP-domain-containing protein n=1 Tax=Sistotremastrum niveocremeum HHB9708 TaxID=1314777 RepID=A0A164PEG3_9AGAM|nr:hypothetical protein SISNIDRAFT_475905 [Sistotremastrum niveocremeum HHB9708]